MMILMEVAKSLDIDLANMQVTFVAHRGFAPNGETIYYIATDASVQEMLQKR